MSCGHRRQNDNSGRQMPCAHPYPECPEGIVGPWVKCYKHPPKQFSLKEFAVNADSYVETEVFRREKWQHGDHVWFVWKLDERAT